MSNIFGLTNIGRLGLQANQTALNVTGSNIANVNTPGYSRREAVFGALRDGGVRVLSVNRLGDRFVDAQLRDSNARLGSSQTRSQNLQSLELALQEGDNSGVSKSFQDFFASLQDLTVKPSGTAERQAVRGQAQALLATLRATATQVADLRQQNDEQVRQSIDRVNSITSQLAQINQRLTSAGPSDADLNDLKDQQDKLTNELSSIIPINVLTDDRGLATVIGQGGLTLVEGTNSQKLSAVPDPSDHSYAHVGIVGVGGSTTIIEDRLTQGSLGALVRTRDQDELTTLNQIDRTTAELVRSFNAQHRQGTGLDGVTGRDFFTGLGVTAHTGVGNTGGATIGSGAITDESQLTFHDYEIRFTGAGTYDVVDATSGTTLSAGNAYTSGSAISFAGISVAIADGAAGPAKGDVFRVNSYADTTQRAGISAAVTASTDAIAAGTTSAPGDNQNALALAAIQNANLFNGNQTIEGYYNNARTTVAQAVNTAFGQAEGEQISQSQIQQLSDGQRAVSIDDEATNLIQFQRAFEASSRIITTTDSLLQTIINMVQ